MRQLKKKGLIKSVTDDKSIDSKVQLKQSNQVIGDYSLTYKEKVNDLVSKDSAS